MKSTAKARQLAALIMQVRTGQLSATTAARQLGISRKTYYQWEQRALQGMMKELEPRPPGRPNRSPDPEKRKLQQKIGDLEKQLTGNRQLIQIRERLRQLREAPVKKKKKPSPRSSP
jgi:transposase